MASRTGVRHGRFAAPTLTATFLLAAGGGALPATAAPESSNPTVVVRGYSHTETFPDDICGARASVVTFTSTVYQSRVVERADGSWSYRDVSPVTYQVDFVDPDLVDYTGRLTEVNNFVFTPGDTFVVSNTYSDFGGDLKIWERTNFKLVNGEIVVDRFLIKVTGCP